MTRIYQPAAAGAGSGLHADLTDVSANQHHAKLHATDHLAAGADAITNIAFLHANTLDHSNALDHASTNDPTANQKAALAGTGTPGALDKYVNDSDSRMTNSRTPSAHVLDGVLHTVSGLTIGHVLKATGAAAAAFGQLLHSQLGSVGADDHHAQAHTLTSHSTRAHSELSSVGVDDHHAQVHGSAAHSGTIGAHTDLSGVTSDQHHAQAHHATHEPSGNDALLVASGSYTPGAVTVADGTWLLSVGKYKLTSTLALIARGTAAVKVIGEAR